MIVLFTDFGLHGPYVGQIHAVLAQQAPGVPVIDLFHDVPPHDIRAGAYLLPAYTQEFPPETVVVAVVDPGVGGSRRALLVRADHRWVVGPDNGLLHPLMRRATEIECREIRWAPDRLSASFHGRDLFAPVAAQLARGRIPESRPVEPATPAGDWPDDLAEAVYIDHFGNVLTGLRAGSLPAGASLSVNGATIPRARTFSEVPPGGLFWYENSNGLAEIAANCARAADILKITVGSPIGII
jgi:S-adenosylmethionine hydrolase